MTVSVAYKAQIRAFEGTVKNAAGLHVAYNKGDRWTIGFGNTYYENGTAVKQGDTITEVRAISLFNTVLDSFAREVTKLLSRSISQNRFDALCSIAYNIGIGAFKTSTLLRKVNLNPNDPTIESEFNKWVYSKGQKLNGLVTRRAKESAYYFGKSTEAINPTNTGLVFIAILFLTILYFKKNEKTDKISTR